jgi:putative transposase
MPASKKKRTTVTPEPSMSDPSPPELPEQQVFHQHLRRLAQSAVRIVIETVMREELDAFIGAAWGESSPKRKGYRNGTYTRDLVTSTGRLEQIKCPEIGKASSTPRSLSAIVAMNPILRKDSRRCSSRAQARRK